MPMGSHPANLALRFVLELAALAAMGMWGWQLGHGAFRYVSAAAVPVIAAAVWVIFAVPHDPSRSGGAPIPVSGTLRLCVELAFFAFAVWALFATRNEKPGIILGVTVVAHYALSYDRIAWLLRA